MQGFLWNLKEEWNGGMTIGKDDECYINAERNTGEFDNLSIHATFYWSTFFLFCVSMLLPVDEIAFQKHGVTNLCAAETYIEEYQQLE